MKTIRKRLTYANVMSSIAVFLVIGGATAFAALGKNTVGTKQLKKNAVTTTKIKDGAVTSSKVNVSGFPKVPNAANADNATNAGHATNADHATSADKATNAGHATSADTATTATSANTANFAGFAEGSEFTENVMTALVNSDGTIISSVPPGTTSIRLGTGIYEVNFHTPIAGCTWSVSPSGNDFVPQLGEASAVPRAGNPEALFVDRANSGGTLTDGDLFAELVC